MIFLGVTNNLGNGSILPVSEGASDNLLSIARPRFVFLQSPQTVLSV
jgi:hypothetical protein